MVRLVGVLATLVCLVAGFAIAATRDSQVDGLWEGTVNAINGSVAITYHFTVKGQVLTGMKSSKSPEFSREISDGKIDGNKISFKTTVNGKTIEHEGTVSGYTIQLINHGPYGEFSATLKRVSTEKKSGQQ